MANPAALRRIVTERRVVQQADLQAEEPDAPLAKVCGCPHASGGALAQAARACRHLKCVTLSERRRPGAASGTTLASGSELRTALLRLAPLALRAVSTMPPSARYPTSPLGYAMRPNRVILISPRVLMKVENAVKVEPAGEFELKGIRRPLAAYNVVSASS
jgi:class 3 adenylate cyclase